MPGDPLLLLAKKLFTDLRNNVMIELQFEFYTRCF